MINFHPMQYFFILFALNFILFSSNIKAQPPYFSNSTNASLPNGETFSNGSASTLTQNRTLDLSSPIRSNNSSSQLSSSQSRNETEGDVDPTVNQLSNEITDSFPAIFQFPPFATEQVLPRNISSILSPYLNASFTPFAQQEELLSPSSPSSVDALNAFPPFLSSPEEQSMQQPPPSTLSSNSSTPNFSPAISTNHSNNSNYSNTASQGNPSSYKSGSGLSRGYNSNLWRMTSAITSAMILLQIY